MEVSLDDELATAVNAWLKTQPAMLLSIVKSTKKSRLRSAFKTTASSHADLAQR
jgi:predicted oxidoreductase